MPRLFVGVRNIRLPIANISLFEFILVGCIIFVEESKVNRNR